MKSLLDKEEYSEEDIYAFIENEVEESIHLDFKEAAALGKSEGKKKEFSKDIASFANSDGGIIIYGLKEIDHKAHSLSFVDGNEFTKEWIEQLINSTIQRHIPDIKIFPVRFESSIEKTVYVVKIPKSIDAPHISRDKRFYKRFNFESVYMEEYEIRQLYGRKSKSKLVIGGYAISQQKSDNEEIIKICIEPSIINIGDIPESSYKLNLYFNKLGKHTAITWDKIDQNYDYTRFEDKRVKLSTSKSPTIYPSEQVDAMRINIEIEKEFASETLNSLDFELVLFYKNGEDKVNGNFKDSIDKIKY